MLSDVDTVILAGGVGSRIRPVLQNLPKVLAPVGGRPFLTYLLDDLLRQGLRRVVICTGHLGEHVEATIGSRYGALSVEYSRESTPRGTGGAIRHALPLIRTSLAVVLNGDTYCSMHLASFLAWCRARRARASLAIARVSDRRRFGSVDVGHGGNVLSFREKDPDGGPGWACVGAYVLPYETIATISLDKMYSIERDILPLLVGHGLFAFPVDGPFLDIGTPESYGQAEAFFSQLGNLISPVARPPSKDRVVLLDRDGTLNVERNYLAKADELELLPGAIDGLQKLQSMGYRLVVVTNQSGVARGYMDERELTALHDRLRALLGNGGVELAGIYACPHLPEQRCQCRKPKPGLVERAATELRFDPKNAVVVGDKSCDIELARQIGATAILVTTGYGRETVGALEAEADFVVDSLSVAADVIGNVGQRSVLGTGS